MTESWHEQYDMFIKFLTESDNRFWTRFNVSLLINGGLIVAFATLNNISQSPTSLIVKLTLLGIPIMGITCSVLWIYITRAGRA